MQEHVTRGRDGRGEGFPDGPGVEGANANGDGSDEGEIPFVILGADVGKGLGEEGEADEAGHPNQDGEQQFQGVDEETEGEEGEGPDFDEDRGDEEEGGEPPAVALNASECADGRCQDEEVALGGPKAAGGAEEGEGEKPTGEFVVVGEGENLAEESLEGGPESEEIEFGPEETAPGRGEIGEGGEENGEGGAVAEVMGDDAAVEHAPALPPVERSGREAGEEGMGVRLDEAFDCQGDGEGDPDSAGERPRHPASQGTASSRMICFRSRVMRQQ